MSLLVPTLSGGGGGESGGRNSGGGGGSSGARNSATEYALGFRPAYRLFTEGQQVVTRPTGRGAEMAALDYQAAISRVECSLGIDRVNTLTITFTGVEAALLVKEKFAKRQHIRLELGYDDHPQDFQTVIEGHALMAYPTGTNPVEVDLEVDSLMYQAREDRSAGDNTDPNQAEYIQSRLSQQPTPITCNLADDQIDGQLDEGGTNDKEDGSLLDFIQAWSKANYVHWIDQMDGKAHFFYPGAKVPLYRDFRTWSLSVRRTKAGDDDPAILSEWSPRQEFVEAPYEIHAVWYDANQPDLQGVPVTSEPNPNGVPDSSLTIGPILTKTQQEAQDMVNAAAADFYWHSIQGSFALDAGVPIMPLDDIVALSGPPGLEEYYDRPFEVVEVTHVLDARGWTVRGKIRGGRA